LKGFAGNAVKCEIALLSGELGEGQRNSRDTPHIFAEEIC
jgi:hypothetical protein